MQWYKLILGEENLRQDSLFATEEDFGELEPWDFKECKRIDEDGTVLLYKVATPKDDGTPDDILSEHLGIPVFSPRLSTALEENKIGTDDVQYIPVSILSSKGKPIDKFKLANVLTQVDAIDIPNCILIDPDLPRIDPETGELDTINILKMALYEHALRNHDIVRLTNFLPPVFVSERFAQIFNDNQCTGAILSKMIMT